MAVQKLICYVPVIHQGYIEFFESYPDAEIHVLSRSVLASRFDYLRKDVRTLEPSSVVRLLKGMGRSATEVKSDSQVKSLFETAGVIMPDDDISHALDEEFGGENVTFEPVFLRWDRKAIDTNQDVQPDRTVSINADDPIIATLCQEASKSTNWWRSVGAALVIDNTVIAAGHNSPMPTEYSSAIYGDPRILSGRGADIDLSIDIHAEPSAIGRAAAEGKALAGAALYVTTFPCPTCAKLIAASGIAQCYYVEGYATLDGQSILKANNVEIIKVKTKLPELSRQKPKEYPAN